MIAAVVVGGVDSKRAFTTLRLYVYFPSLTWNPPLMTVAPQPHITTFMGSSFNCQNKFSDCGYIPLIEIDGAEIAMFNEPFTLNQAATIMTRIRVSIAGEERMVFSTTGPFMSTSSDPDFEIESLGAFDSRVRFTAQSLEFRIWRLSASSVLYLNIDIQVRWRGGAETGDGVLVFLFLCCVVLVAIKD